MGRVIAVFWIGFLWGCNGQPPAVGVLAEFHEGRQSTSHEISVDEQQLSQPLRISKDLGVVRTGSKHEVEFEITNPSESDWTLRDITKTCRCVVADPLPQIIRKQSSAKLKLTIEAGQAAGDFDRQVRMNFTNPTGPVVMPVVLEVKTRMRTPLYVSCRELRFPPSPPGVTTQATARVENWSDANWEALEVTPSVDWIQAHVEPPHVPANAQDGLGLHVKQLWNIIFTASPPPEVTGTITQSVVIKAVGADFSKTLPAVGERPHPVISRPPALIVSRGSSAAVNSSDGRKLVATLRLPLTSPAKSFQVLSVTGKLLDECEIRFEQTSETEARVEVVIPPSKSGGISGRVVVRFADGIPDLMIPVAGGV